MRLPMARPNEYAPHFIVKDREAIPFASTSFFFRVVNTWNGKICFFSGSHATHSESIIAVLTSTKADGPRDEDDDVGDTNHESNALIIHQISWKDNQGQDETTEECFKAAQEQDAIIN